MKANFAGVIAAQAKAPFLPDESALNRQSSVKMSSPMNGVKQADLGMLPWALLVGLSFPAVRLLSEGLPPLLLTAIRFVIAALAIWPLVLNKPSRWPSLPGFVLYTLMGLCLAGFFSAMFWAAHRTTALSMATLYVSVPLLAYFLGRAFGVERRSFLLLGILLLGAVGALGLRGRKLNGCSVLYNLAWPKRPSLSGA